MEQYIVYPQLLIVALYCIYLIIGSRLRKTLFTWTLLLGSSLLAGALAYRMTHPEGSNVLQWLFQVSNILVYGSLLAFEVKNTKRLRP